MVVLINLTTLVILVIVFVESRASRDRFKDLDDIQTARDAIREHAVGLSKWTAEDEKEHVARFEATAREMFQPWCGPKSFLSGTIGAVVSVISGYTLLPGLMAGLCFSSPKLYAYFIRAIHIIRGAA